MLSNLVCNHTCEKQIWLQLCCRQILLSLVWLETELYWTPVSPITITNTVIRFRSHPFWNDWSSLHSDARQTLSLSYAWRFDLIAACSCCLSGSSVHLICEEDWLVSYFSLCWSSLDKIMFVVFILLFKLPYISQLHWEVGITSIKLLRLCSEEYCDPLRLFLNQIKHSCYGPLETLIIYIFYFDEFW